MGTFLTPAGFGPLTLHAAPLHPPPAWIPCTLPAGEGSRAPPGRSLAKAGADEIATATLNARAAMTPASVLLNVAFISFLLSPRTCDLRPTLLLLLPAPRTAPVASYWLVGPAYRLDRAAHAIAASRAVLVVSTGIIRGARAAGTARLGLGNVFNAGRIRPFDVARGSPASSSCLDSLHIAGR